jgi:hypothetical protein
LKKHDNFRINSYSYDEKGKHITDTSVYFDREDFYVHEKDLEENTVSHDYHKSNMGYALQRNGTDYSEFYFCEPDDSDYTNLPCTDDPDVDREPEYGYSDGNNYYYSEVINPKSEEWLRVESIIDAKTYEVLSDAFYLKDENGKEYKYQEQRIEKDVETPDMYQSLKYHFAAEGKKKVKFECIIDPGTPDERRFSHDIQEGVDVKFKVPYGYKVYMDAEGKIPVPDKRDTSRDITTYYIKNK